MMVFEHLWRRATFRVLACVVVVAVTLVPALAQAESKGSYREIKLVSDQPGVAMFRDPNLVNAWGLSRSSSSPWWVSDNGKGVSTLYKGDGTAVPLVVTIPTPPGGTPPATPTGTVFNDASATHPDEFVVSASGKSGPSFFLFATEDGTISGWNRQVDGTHAILAVDRSMAKQGTLQGAVYKGLANGQRHGHDFLYATNFRFGTVEMFDAQFHLVGSFTDRKLADDCPMPGQCFAPFGIQNIEGRLYVTYALQDAEKHDDAAGAGNGFVDVFNTDGTLLRRFAAHGPLNSPWGLALAPKGFGEFSGDLLVGNFGDGRINAFDVHSGRFQGQMKDEKEQPITIAGLWALAFGNGAQAGGLNELFFSSGPDDEQHGLFGKILAANMDR
jgi:uncharacterized protein (TIGR03118 family)